MYQFTTASKKLLGDLHTPVSLYLKLRDVYPQSALLESSDYHGNENSLSFIALRPIARIGVNNGEAVMDFPDGRSSAKRLGGDYTTADALKEFLAGFRITATAANTADCSATRRSTRSATSKTSPSKSTTTRIPTPPTSAIYSINTCWFSTISKTSWRSSNCAPTASRTTCARSKR